MASSHDPESFRGWCVGLGVTALVHVGVFSLAVGRTTPPEIEVLEEEMIEIELVEEPEPIHEPEPIPEPEPIREPEPKPEPIPKLEPIPEPELEPISEPIKPKVVPKPVPPKPKPVYKPRPRPKPKMVAPQPRPKPSAPKPKAKPRPTKKLPVVGTPVATRRAKPSYPKAERRKGIEGTVVVSVRVDPNGRAGAVIVARSSGSSALDASAVKAVRRWRFKAATDSVGNPISKVVNVPVVFKLK